MKRQMRILLFKSSMFVCLFAFFALGQNLDTALYCFHQSTYFSNRSKPDTSFKSNNDSTNHNKPNDTRNPNTTVQIDSGNHKSSIIISTGMFFPGSILGAEVLFGSKIVGINIGAGILGAHAGLYLCVFNNNKFDISINVLGDYMWVLNTSISPEISIGINGFFARMTGIGCRIGFAEINSLQNANSFFNTNNGPVPVLAFSLYVPVILKH